MKRHLSIVLIVAGVFVFFMAPAEAEDVGMFFAKPSLTTMIQETGPRPGLSASFSGWESVLYFSIPSNRCVSMMDVVSRIPVYIRLFLDVPAVNFRLQDIGYRSIENIKQIEQSV